METSTRKRRMVSSSVLIKKSCAINVSCFLVHACATIGLTNSYPWCNVSRTLSRRHPPESHLQQLDTSVESNPHGETFSKIFLVFPSGFLVLLPPWTLLCVQPWAHSYNHSHVHTCSDCLTKLQEERYCDTLVRTKNVLHVTSTVSHLTQIFHPTHASQFPWSHTCGS